MTLGERSRLAARMNNTTPKIDVKLNSQTGGTSMGIAGTIQPDSLVEKCNRAPPTIHAPEAAIPIARERVIFRASACAARTSSLVRARGKIRQYQSGVGG